MKLPRRCFLQVAGAAAAAPVFPISRSHERGGIPLTGSPAKFEKLFVDAARKWAEVMREANVKPE